jgi:hypothetical protein
LHWFFLLHRAPANLANVYLLTRPNSRNIHECVQTTWFSKAAHVFCSGSYLFQYLEGHSDFVVSFYWVQSESQLHCTFSIYLSLRHLLSTTKNAY